MTLPRSVSTSRSWSAWATCVVLLVAAGVQLRAQQSPPRKIGEMDLAIRGLVATTDPTLTIPKHVASGLRVTLRAGTQEVAPADVARFLGTGFHAAGELAGPGLSQPLSLPQPGDPPNDDPLFLRLPALSTGGSYTLANLRLVRDGHSVLDVTPSSIAIEVIDEILITSVKTRPLTLDEIKQRGIVLDSDDYLGFEFTLAMKLESKPVQVSFPVVFDRQNVPVPEMLKPPSVSREGLPLPTIVPVLLEPILEGSGGGEKVPMTPEEAREARIPGVLVIPGNVGYLKQFFSAQLFVANGAPAGSRLSVHDVAGTIVLPKGPDGDPGTGDDPLSLAQTETGVHATLPVRGVGADGAPGTADDDDALAPGEQGQAEFLVRGDAEGSHEIAFDITARLEGLAVGPVTVKGKASGAVLVRNAFYDITFTAPGVVRDGETFSLFATVTNIGQGIGNDLHVAIDASRLSGMRISGDATKTIPTLMPGDAATLEFEFVAERTGQVVASYIRFDTNDGSTGHLQFTAGIGDRGVPLSPDTLVLPAVVDELPDDVVRAAMRVLGQAWSAATAPPGTLPRGVTRPGKDVVFTKAQALAEAGLRVTLGQPRDAALRDLLFDFYGGTSADGSVTARVDRGFDQVLRETSAGYALAQTLGTALTTYGSIGNALALERTIAQVAASGPDFLSIGVHAGQAGALDVALSDATGQRTVLGRTSTVRPESTVPGAAFLPLGGAMPASDAIGLIATTSGGPYTIALAARDATTTGLSVTLPRGDGTFVRGSVDGLSLAAQARARVVIDPGRPDELTLEIDPNGDGLFDTQQALMTETLQPQGARLVSANVIGPETLDNAAPFGQHAVLVFDRLVSPEAAADVAAYQVPKNTVVAAKRVLSGRLVVLTLEQPEGSHVATTLGLATGMSDLRGVSGAGGSVTLGSRIEDDGAVVSGRVLQADGTPVRSGAVYYRNNIDLTFCQIPPTGLPGIAKIDLDSEGRYEFRFVRRDSCGFPFEITTVDPNTGGLVATSRYVRYDGEQILVDLVLFGRGRVTGTVRDLNHRAVAGADVVVLSGTDAQIGGLTRTDGEGQYTVSGITVGPVTVRAAKGTSLGHAAGRIDRAGSTEHVDVTLDGGAVRVSGTVFVRRGASTAPLAGAYVGYRVGSANGNVVGVAQTTAEGQYVLEGMPTGAFTIDATCEGFHAFVSGVAAAGDDLTRNLLIERPGIDNSGLVHGRVVLPSGAGAAQAIVTEGGRGVLTDGEGYFDLPIPVDKTVTLFATLRDESRSGSVTTSVRNEGDIVDVTITLSGLARARVTVVDANGVRVAGAVVRRLDCNDPCGCVGGTTDAQGEVVIEKIKLGTLGLMVVRSDGGLFDVASAQVRATRDGETIEGVVLRFVGHGLVSGRVLNADGSPSHGADIELTSLRFINDGLTCGLTPTVSHRVRTDMQGRFRLTGVNVGPVEVFASHFEQPQRVGAKGVLTAAGQEVAFELRLIDTTAGELSGVVYLPDGVTPAGAGVEVTVNGVLPDVTVRTNEQGAYAFARILPAGQYTMTVRDPITGGLAQSSLVLQTNQPARYDVRLKGRGTVRVTVFDAANRPVTNASVRLTEVDFPRRTYDRSIEASNEGVAVFERVFEGAITLEASDLLGRGGRLSTVIPGPDAVVDAKIRFGVTGTVTGTFVLPDGTTPIRNAVVRLIAGGRVIGQATTSADPAHEGEFTFEYVPAGQFRLEAQDRATARTGVAVGSIATQDEPVDVTIVAQSLGTVQGTAYSNGLPQPGARIVIESGSYRVETIADDQAHFVVNGVPEGRVVVTASLDGAFLSGSAEATLTGDGTTVTIDVSLRNTGILTGHVITATGGNAAYVLVTASSSGTGGGRQSTTANETGHFRFEKVPTGSVTVDVEVPGSIDRGRGSIVVPEPVGGSEPATANITVPLNGVGTLRVRAHNSTGALTAGYVEIRGSGPFPYTRAIDVPPAGEFTVPDVLAGP